MYQALRSACVIRATVPLHVCPRNIEKVIQTLARAKDFLNRGLILRVVHIAVYEHICVGLPAQNVVQVPSKEARFIPAKKRFSCRDRQLRFEVRSNETQPIRRIHLYRDVKKSALDPRSLSVQLKLN